LTEPPDPEAALRATVRRWIEQVVIGLDLCPFAAAPYRAGRVQVRVSAATTLDAAVGDVADALQQLITTSVGELSTTLIAIPSLSVHEDFLATLGAVDALVEQAGAAPLVQIVGFHPDAVFEGADPSDPANAAARAPMPVVHLLRVEEVADAIATHPDAAGISDRNAERLRAIGAAGLAAIGAAGTVPESPG